MRVYIAAAFLLAFVQFTHAFPPPTRVYVPQPVRRFDWKNVSTTPKPPSIVTSQQSDYLRRTAIDRARLEQGTVDKNVLDLRRIVKLANEPGYAGKLDLTKLHALLAEVNASDSKSDPQGGARKWSYESGSLMVKGKVGDFEYKQAFSVQGTAKTGAATGAGAALAVCALEGKKGESCVKDSLNFFYDITLPDAARK